MPEQIGYPGRLSHIRRLHSGFKYGLLTLIILFILYQISSWTPHQNTTPEHAPGQHSPATFHTDSTTFPSASENDFETISTESTTILTSRVGKVTSVYYDEPNEHTQAYESALLSHEEHDSRYRYKHYVQRRPAIEKLWSKHAYLIHILVQELNKPPAERLDWLFWHDADVVLLNSLMPLEAYLPPDGDRWAHINLLVTNDMGGLNDGVFFVRVCEWSVYFFAAGLSFRYYRPDTILRYDEQTALGFLLDEEKYKNNTLHVPQRWINAYQDFGVDDTIPEEWHWRFDYVEPGDLLVHLPGTAGGRTSIIHEWLDRLQKERDTYAVPLHETNYSARFKDFWDSEAETEYKRQDVYWRRYNILRDVGSKADDATKEGKEKLEKSLAAAGTNPAAIEDSVKEYEESRKGVKKNLLRDREEAILDGSWPDNVRAD